jgi:TP901 family phage tail tape measure protein
VANNLSLGIVIGATVSGTVARAFETINQRATRLGSSLQHVRLGRAASDDVIRYRTVLENLRSSQQQFGTSNTRLWGQIADAERHLRTASAAAERYGINVGQIVSENRRLIQSEQRLAGQLERTNIHRANRARRSELGGQMMGTAGMAIGAAYALAAPIKETMEFESTMADVRKVVEMTDAELKTMGKTIITMTTTMPMAASGIGAIVAAAGQSGIAKNELIEFTKAAVKMGVAFDMTGEEAGQMMASFRAGMAISQPEVEALADAINYLDTNMNASAKNISDVVQRQGAVAKAAGLSSIQTAALSAALLNSGARSEIAATALKNLTNALTQGGSATKAQNKVFEQLGMTSKAVTARMQKDAEGTIKSVFAALAKAPAEMRGAMVGDLFGEEAKGAIMPLLVNIKALDQAFNSVADATKYAGSMQAEYDIRSKTTANNAQLLSNKFDALKINIGAALLPTLNSVFGVIGNLAMKMGSFADNFPRVTGVIVGLTIGLIGLKVAMLAGGYAITLISDAWTLASGAMAFFRVGSGATAITLVSQKLAISGMWMAQKAMAAWTATCTAAQWLWNVALSANPIGLVVIGITAFGVLAYTVYKNWEPIAAWFKGVWATMSAGVGGMVASVTGAFSTMAATVRGIWESLINWLSAKFAQIGAAANGLISTAQTIGNTVSSIGKFMTTPIIGKGAAVGAAMAATAAMPASATPLPSMPNAKHPQSVMYSTNATDKRGRLHD